MKAKIHPQWYPEAAVTCQSCGKTWTTGATVSEITTEICSNCHPFFTGEQRIVDTEGRVEKFLKRLQQRDEIGSQPSDDEGTSADSINLEDIELSKRHLNVLTGHGLNTVADVLSILDANGDEGITALDGLGQQALIDLKKGIRAQGFEIPEA